jgi:hypothetical protein
MTERKRADEERQALSRKLEESKARLEEAQRVAHIGHYEWNLIANRVTWSDERAISSPGKYFIYRTKPFASMASIPAKVRFHSNAFTRPLIRRTSPP